MNNIYLFKEYKEYILAQIQASRRTKGYQGLLATAANCQPSFLSKVLNGPIHLTPDHAAGLTRYWQLDGAESEYFMQLVALARAGTLLLRDLIHHRLTTLKQEQQNLQNQLKLPEIGKENLESFYYSSWYIAAIHVLLSIPNFQNIEQISKRLSLAEDVVANVLSKLVEFGLVTQSGKNWLVGHSQIHLPTHSAFYSLNHINWRQQALLDLLKKRQDSLHFSAIYSLSARDIEIINQEIINLITRTTNLVHTSPAEKLICFNIDYFEP